MHSAIESGTGVRRDAAMSFLRLAAAGEVNEAFDRYVGDGFTHHNPYFAGDASALKEGMAESAKAHPNKLFDIQRTLEDGDLVAVHARVRIESAGPDIALIHIFRFYGDRIVEMWEASQEVPADLPNENGMF